MNEGDRREMNGRGERDRANQSKIDEREYWLGRYGKINEEYSGLLGCQQEVKRWG
jgi:hypothetical protein